MSAWQRVWIQTEGRRKRGPSYQVCYTDRTTGKRKVRRSFRTDRIARAYAHRLELHLNGEGPDPDQAIEVPGNGPTQEVVRRPWTEAVITWVNSGSIRPSTRRHYRCQLQHFGRLAGIEFLEDVTEQVISDFLNRRAKGTAKATIAGDLRTLNTFFLVVRPDDNPMTATLKAQWKPYKVHKRARPHYYTEDEFRRILKTCDATPFQRPGDRGALWWKAFITLLHDTGVRLGEATHLIWRDVDFEAGLIQIQPHERLKGVFPWRPKGKSHRTLPMTPELATLLAELQQRQAEGVPYVFLNAGRYAEIQRKGLSFSGDIMHNVRKSFVKIRNRAGVEEGTIHDMRRTCITNWARHPEMKAKDVQILAGHEDIHTTLEIYTMVEEGDAVAKAKRLIEKRVKTSNPEALESDRPADATGADSGDDS